MEEELLHPHDHDCHDHEHHHHDHEHHHHDHEHECHDPDCHDPSHHHHDHDHECHDPDCHDPSHHHHHDHEHECHDPDCHDPSHHHDHGPAGPIRIRRHEGAVIGDVKGALTVEYAGAEERFRAAMQEAVRRVEAAGGIVGHIKFLLRADGPCTQLSITDTEVNVRRFDGDGCHAEGVAIVFGLEETELEHILTETVGALLRAE